MTTSTDCGLIQPFFSHSELKVRIGVGSAVRVGMDVGMGVGTVVGVTVERPKFQLNALNVGILYLSAD